MHDMADKKTRQFTFRTSDDVMNELERLAKLEDRPVGWVVERALRDWLAWREPGAYNAPVGATAPADTSDILRLWANLAPAQRKLVHDMMKSGALDVREDEGPVLNEPGKTQ
jgi:hypothetical protein